MLQNDVVCLLLVNTINKSHEYSITSIDNSATDQTEPCSLTSDLKHTFTLFSVQMFNSCAVKKKVFCSDFWGGKFLLAVQNFLETRFFVAFIFPRI